MVVADVFIMPVAVVFTVGFVVFFVVADQIAQSEAVMCGDEIDAAKGWRPLWLKISDDPAKRSANAPKLPLSHDQNARISSRKRPFHSAKGCGKLPK